MFLGSHTIAETRGIMQSIDHRFTVVDKSFQDALASHPTQTTPLAANWNALKKRWGADKADANALMAIKKATSPLQLAGEENVPAENQYQQILAYVEGDTGDPHVHPNDSIRGIQIQLEAIIAQPIDIDTGNPANDPNNPIQKLAMKDTDTAILQSQTIASMADAGKIILQNAGFETDAQCAPAAQSVLRAGFKSQGMPDAAIDAYFAAKCKKNTSLRTTAYIIGGILVLVFGIQFVAPVIVAVRSLAPKK